MLEKHLRVILDFKIKIDDITSRREGAEAQKQLLTALLEDEALLRQFL